MIRPDDVFTVRAEVSKHYSCYVDPSLDTSGSSEKPPQGEREKLEASPGRINRSHKSAVAVTPTFFDTAAAFRIWLASKHASAAELVVGFRKVGSGLPSMTWPESVDEALCFGWIDGVRKRIDDEAYQIRFTPRRNASIWSLVNVAKVEHLLAQGRMQPSGIAAYEDRSVKKTGVYAFERERPAELSDAETRGFRKNKLAWRYFEAAAPSYKRVMLHWVVSAKQTATRQRRLAQLIEACAEQGRILR